MNLHLDRYLAGSAYFVGVRYRKGGKSFRVFDQTARWRQAAKAMRKAGLPVEKIAWRLGRRPAAVALVLAGFWPSRPMDWKISNSPLAK